MDEFSNIFKAREFNAKQIADADAKNANLIASGIRTGLSGIGDGIKIGITSAIELLKAGFQFLGSVGQNEVLMHFIIMAFIISIIVIGVFSYGNVKQPSNNYVKLPELSAYNPLGFINKYIPSHKMKLFSYDFTPYSAKIDTSITDRPITTGRCDNLNYLDAGDSGVCLNTLEPVPIEWTLDVNKMPELQQISSKTKDLFNGNEALKYIVTIPWKSYARDGLYFYPDCSAATFGNGESAGYLFIDNDTHSCERIMVPRTITNKTEQREKVGTEKFDRLDTYLLQK